MSTALLLSFIRKNDYHNTISIKKGTKNIVSSFGSLNSHHHHNHRYINILQQRNNNRIHYQQTQQWRNFISKMILISLSSISLLIVSSNTTDNSSVVDDDNITNNIDNGNITKNYNIQFFDRNNIWSIFHNINKTKFISTNHDNDITEAEELTSTIAETNNEKEETTKDNTTTVINWSGTHSVNVLNERYWEPNTEQEVIDIMKYCHENHISIRPTGSSLSPNGISLSNDGMINLVNIDELIHVDTNNHTVTVQAGARVSQVIEMLKEYHYTLPNLASIAEQQMGGFISISAHGTGAAISPIDHYVTKLKIVTPAHSIITLTEADGDIFHMMKVGLGCFGILLEITMKCIPAHNLVEHTYILTRQQAKEQCNTLLKKHKHIRYMWIPYTDTVIVVTNNPVDAFTNEEIHSIQNNIVQNNNNQNNNHNKVQPIIDFLIELDPNSTESDYTNIGFGELRDRMLSYNPLNINHVKKCNEVEALFWKNSTGYQIRPSDELLQFDCGGQQWVWEVCFPTGTQDVNNGNDMLFMDDLLKGIEDDIGIPAHSPIEQRWSASSSSYMSPAYEPTMNGLHTWVGIINYLPSDETLMDPMTLQKQRNDITSSFKGIYCDLVRNIGYKYNATSHWAKLETPNTIWKLIDLRLFLEKRFPIDQFNHLRGIYDPNNILANPFITFILGKPKQ